MKYITAKVTAMIIFENGAMDGGSTKLGVAPNGGGKYDIRVKFRAGILTQSVLLGVCALGACNPIILKNDVRRQVFKKELKSRRDDDIGKYYQNPGKVPVCLIVTQA